MLIKEAMSSKVETISPKSSVQECARLMRQLDVGVLPVWQDGQLLGMVTDRDVCCRAVGDGRNPAAVEVREIMSRDITSCFEDEDCIEAARVMKEKHLRRLPVMNRKRALVGVVSIDDLARYSHDLAGEILEQAAPWPH